MSIIDIDQRKVVKIFSQGRPSWQQRFRTNLYLNNYNKYYKNQVTQNLQHEQHRNQASYTIVNMIKSSATSSSLQSSQSNGHYLFNTRISIPPKQFYDNQQIQPYYSPYSIFIPLQNQSYMNDQIVNTFSFIQHLKDTAKRQQMMNYYQQIRLYFKNGKNQGKQYVMQQWMKVKYKFICTFDTITALSLLIQILRKNSQIIPNLHKTHSPLCHPQIFIYRITRGSKYIRSSLKTHNLKISVQVCDQINQKTLPMIMKTWYCALCLCYDCEKHKLENKVAEYQLEYVSQKNKKNQAEHIQAIIKLLKFCQILKQQKESNMTELEEKSQKQKQNQNQKQKLKKGCGPECYLNLTKKDLQRLMLVRHKLISPLAKSLLKMGIQIFSYNPCQIWHIFQSKYQKSSTTIHCNEIFVNFTQQCNLTDLLNQKMQKSQIDHLRQQSSKLIDLNIKIPLNPHLQSHKKQNKHIYQQKRSKNQNPQFATCMHIFLNHTPIDHRCQQCVCRQRGFCLPSCLCTQGCQIRRIGCLCKGNDTCQSQKCLCFVNKMECQPGICGECFVGKCTLKKNNCKNDQIFRDFKKRYFVGISKIPGAGLGAFAGQNFSKNDLVCKYNGQHISSDVDFIREVMIKDLSFYNFDSPNGKVISASIDARFMGNKARFINHGNQGQQNLRAQTMFSNGTQYIALFALRDIKQGEELTFNYDGSGALYANHRDKYPFVKPPSNKKKNDIVIN